jgi:hypothetical protein
VKKIEKEGDKMRTRERKEKNE